MPARECVWRVCGMCVTLHFPCALSACQGKAKRRTKASTIDRSNGHSELPKVAQKFPFDSVSFDSIRFVPRNELERVHRPGWLAARYVFREIYGIRLIFYGK